MWSLLPRYSYKDVLAWTCSENIYHCEKISVHLQNHLSGMLQVPYYNLLICQEKNAVDLKSCTVLGEGPSWVLCCWPWWIKNMASLWLTLHHLSPVRSACTEWLGWWEGTMRKIVEGKICTYRPGLMCTQCVRNHYLGTRCYAQNRAYRPGGSMPYV